MPEPTEAPREDERAEWREDLANEYGDRGAERWRERCRRLMGDRPFDPWCPYCGADADVSGCTEGDCRA